MLSNVNSAFLKFAQQNHFGNKTMSLTPIKPLFHYYKGHHLICIANQLGLYIDITLTEYGISEY